MVSYNRIIAPIFLYINGLILNIKCVLYGLEFCTIWINNINRGQLSEKQTGKKLHFRPDLESTAVKSERFVRWKFSMTTSPGLRLFTISIDVLINTRCNYTADIWTTWHKGCLITFHVPIDKTHPGKAPGKMIYILPLEDCTKNSMYK